MLFGPNSTPNHLIYMILEYYYILMVILTDFESFWLISGVSGQISDRGLTYLQPPFDLPSTSLGPTSL